MKNKLIIKNTKSKFYHKLLNNEVVYDKKPLKRYKQNITSVHSKDKFKNLDLLKSKINSIKNALELSFGKIVHLKAAFNNSIIS